ncbi:MULTISPECIES: hypothetical protein [Vibrio]|uniref:hypothetical protein n=1 Tax=Vibrio TaxID=662 RepID=UPI000619E07E|nr:MULTISPECIES: hypothetical protein [Vibrio]MBO0210623.1 hypothetical protein [Vibrio sp. Vb0877]MCR9657200.1 hypothetical protein [Vibrio parahaemolyticus]MCZ5869555.1 hypothetical protein [Vibrio parahaemolyticus]MCZ5899926.1 hypothetical protein [Vibrio parahaemolyticus]MCZ6308248.1 hypothetical protein [Vibrio parahaemolyticus]
MINEEWFSELETVLFVLEDCQVDCDGMTYLVSHLLKQANVEHCCMFGYVTEKSSGDVVTPHCWITLPGDYIVDLRLRMWLGDFDHIPHGVFKSSCTPDIVYEGKGLRGSNLDVDTLDMMSDGRLSHVKVPSLLH